jgi:hypothetical protein
MPTHYIFTDESGKKGKHYENFFGGIIVNAEHRNDVENALIRCRHDNNLQGEIKWQKTSEAYLDKYASYIDTIFDQITLQKCKCRIMFTHKLFEPTNLTAEQKDNQYFLLYYQFIKHAFGLRFSPSAQNTDIALMMDQLPDTKDKCNKFKEFIVRLNHHKPFRDANVTIKRENISEIDSKKHELSQALDLILGSMYFRLNDHHKKKQPGRFRRGKRTVAKEKLYRHINRRIQRIYRNFNIGISTGKPNGPSDIWDHAYRHWEFIPSQRRRNPNHKTK